MPKNVKHGGAGEDKSTRGGKDVREGTDATERVGCLLQIHPSRGGGVPDQRFETSPPRRLLLPEAATTSSFTPEQEPSSAYGRLGFGWALDFVPVVPHRWTRSLDCSLFVHSHTYPI